MQLHDKEVTFILARKGALMKNKAGTIFLINVVLFNKKNALIWI